MSALGSLPALSFRLTAVPLNKLPSRLQAGWSNKPFNLKKLNKFLICADYHSAQLYTPAAAKAFAKWDNSRICFNWSSLYFSVSLWLIGKRWGDKTVCTNQCNNNINTGLQQDFGPDLCCTGIPRNICWKDWKENPNLRGDVKICMSASGGCVQRNDFPTWGCLLKYCTKSKLNLYFFPFSASLTVYFTTFYPSNFIWWL